MLLHVSGFVCVPIAQQHQSTRSSRSELHKPVLLQFYLLYFATNSIHVSAKSNEQAERPNVILTLEIKLKIISDFAAGNAIS
jgi:hypothetical protein